MTPLRSITVQASGRLAVLTSSIFVSVVVARSLGPEARGDLAKVTASIATLGPLICLSLAESNLFQAAKHSQKLGALLGNSWVVIGLDVCVLALAGMALAWSSPGSWEYYALAWLWMCAQVAFSLASSLAFGVGQVRLVSVTELASNSCVLGSMCLLWWYGGVRVERVLLVRGLACLVAGIFLHDQLRRSSTRVQPSLELLREGWQYGARAYVLVTMGSFLWNCNQFYVNYFLGSAAAGQYAIASQAAFLVQMIPGAFGTVVLPLLVRQPGPLERALLMRQLLPRWALGMALSCVACGLGAYLFLTRLLGPAFAPSLPVLLCLLPGVWMMGVQQMVSLLQSSKMIPVSYIILTTSAVVLSASLNVCLTPEYGLSGAAWSFTLTGLAFCLATFLCYRPLRVPVREPE